MKIFFAGAFGYKFNKHIDIDVLESYFYLSNTHKENIQEHIKECKSFFLDSGAFSAFTQDVKIDIDKYIKFCVDNKIPQYSVLDSIGSAEETLKNQKYMESKGATPQPCFHYGEDWKYLDYYCENYDYVSLGGMVPISTNVLLRWLDTVFSKYPNKKFHGFGLTAKKLMDRYPWYSVDSTSYLMGTKTAAIYIDNKTYCLSGENKSSDELNKISIKDKIEFEKKCKKYNFTLESLRGDSEKDWPQHKKKYWLRCLYNIYYFLDYINNREDPNFKPIQTQLGAFL